MSRLQDAAAPGLHVHLSHGYNETRRVEWQGFQLWTGPVGGGMRWARAEFFGAAMPSIFRV